MSEHLLVYFADLLGTRELAEHKVVELLINLYFYSEHWPRARTYATLLQIVDTRNEVEHEVRAKLVGREERDFDKYGDSAVERSQHAPHGFISDDEVLENDIYVQEYYLHCFALLMEGRNDFLESEKGTTHIKN